jgi:hypothetical protein
MTALLHYDKMLAHMKLFFLIFIEVYVPNQEGEWSLNVF